MRYLSLCSGIEAATVAWRPLGWEAAAFAEFDPESLGADGGFAACFLAERFPEVPNLGDISAITDEQIAALGPLDLVVGGTPCQDLSVAGAREGIDGDRSRLFFEFVRIFDAARRLCGARWALWENVPGAFVSNEGRDFARVAGALAGCELAAPAEGWGWEGVALGDRGLLEWAVLDSQWFGLAQRRDRLFALLDSGAWAARPPVLLEPESLRGDSAPRRAPGSRVTGALTARSLDSSGPCACDGRDSFLVAGPILSNSHGGGWRTGAEEASGNHLIAEVADPISRTEGKTYDHGGKNVRPRNLVLEVAAPITHGGHPGSNPPGRHAEDDVNLVACFDETQITHPEKRSTARPDAASMAHTARPPTVALEAGGMQVRRLTPTECERLFGFPDGWTAIQYRGKPAKDTPRYAGLGNSIPVNVLRWIGRRIQEVTT